MPLSDKDKKIAKSKILSSRIKKLVISFAKMEADKEMQFTNDGDIEIAKKLVQSMRVKLSRIRTELRKRKLFLASFTMRLKSLEYNIAKDTTTITLTKTAPISEIEKNINELIGFDGELKE
jgi:hypothetical protein